MANVLRPLIKSNIAILSQKVALLDLLVAGRGANQASLGESDVPLVYHHVILLLIFCG
jgi:hypothetical protein